MNFFANQMWCEKANTNALNYGIWQVEYTRIKKILYVWSRVNRKNISNYTFCIIIVNGPTVERYFDEIASNNIKKCLEDMFWDIWFRILWNASHEWLKASPGVRCHALIFIRVFRQKRGFISLKYWRMIPER